LPQKHHSPNPSSTRFSNTLLICLAICLNVWSWTQCRWYELQGEGWDFVEHLEDTSQVGVFRSYAVVDGHGQCYPYASEFISRRDYDSWLLTSQICARLAPLLGVLALGATVAKSVHWNSGNCVTGTLLLLACSLTAATGVASTAWCQSSFWTCPWKMGAYVNGFSGCVYLLAWIVAVCCYRRFPETYHERVDEHPTSVVVKKDSGTAAATEAPVSSTSTVGMTVHSAEDEPNRPVPQDNDEESGVTNDQDLDGEMHDIELGEDVIPPPKPQSITAEELLGTNDPIIFSAVAQGAMAIREYAKDIAQWRVSYDTDSSKESSDDDYPSEEESVPEQQEFSVESALKPPSEA